MILGCLGTRRSCIGCFLTIRRTVYPEVHPQATELLLDLHHLESSGLRVAQLPIDPGEEIRSQIVPSVVDVAGHHRGLCLEQTRKRLHQFCKRRSGCIHLLKSGRERDVWCRNWLRPCPNPYWSTARNRNRRVCDIAWPVRRKRACHYTDRWRGVRPWSATHGFLRAPSEIAPAGGRTNPRIAFKRW